MRIRTVLLTVFAVCASLSSVTAASVEQVAVHVSSVEEAVPPLVQKRIAASIQTVGNHVFLNQDSDDIAGRSAEYERIINDIINRVLIGYTVESIAIKPGSRTDLDVRIRPWGDTIRKVNMTIDYGALPEMGQKLVDKDLANAGDMVENLLIGLPVDALDWANGAVKSVMETELETRVPEFYPHIVIRGGTETDVTVYMMPKLPVVRNVRVAIKGKTCRRSSSLVPGTIWSIPTLALKDCRWLSFAAMNRMSWQPFPATCSGSGSSSIMDFT